MPLLFPVVILKMVFEYDIHDLTASSTNTAIRCCIDKFNYGRCHYPSVDLRSLAQLGSISNLKLTFCERRCIILLDNEDYHWHKQLLRTYKSCASGRGTIPRWPWHRNCTLLYENDNDKLHFFYRQLSIDPHQDDIGKCGFEAVL